MINATEVTTFEHGEEDKCVVHMTYGIRYTVDSRQMTSKKTNVENGNDISLFIEIQFEILKFH